MFLTWLSFFFFPFFCFPFFFFRVVLRKVLAKVCVIIFVLWFLLGLVNNIHCQFWIFSFRYKHDGVCVQASVLRILPSHSYFTGICPHSN